MKSSWSLWFSLSVWRSFPTVSPRFGMKRFFSRLLKGLVTLICDPSARSVAATVACLKGSMIQCIESRCCSVVYRFVSGAQTSLRSHGELGPERLRGAEDPAGCRRVLLVLSDGADHGGCPWNLPPGEKFQLALLVLTDCCVILTPWNSFVTPSWLDVGL